jgi:hypothetical protein
MIEEVREEIASMVRAYAQGYLKWALTIGIVAPAYKTAVDILAIKVGDKTIAQLIEEAEGWEK